MFCSSLRPPLLRRLFVFMLPLIASCSNNSAPTVSELRNQLAGEHCRFDHVYEKGCVARGVGLRQWFLSEPHHCDVAAVECLSSMTNPAAYETLISVLTTKSDIETCDGTYPIRTRAVELLGESGYAPAVEPLRRHLASNPVGTLSGGASGCAAGSEPVDVIVEALNKLAQ